MLYGSCLERHVEGANAIGSLYGGKFRTEDELVARLVGRIIQDMVIAESHAVNKRYLASNATHQKI